MRSITSITAGDEVRRSEVSEKGSILFIVAVCLVVLLGFMGLAIDLGHAYNNKSLLQNMADACALAGGSALNATPAGIAQAETRARDAANNLANKTEFNGKAVTIPASAVTFSVSLNGPWLARAAAEDPAVAPTIRYVKVDVPPQTSDVVFAKIVPGVPTALTFGADAVAGQWALQEVCRGLDPFSPVRRDTGPYGPPTNPLPTPPPLPGDFGYVRGQTYELRLSPGNSGKNCGEQGVPGCVTGNFGFADVTGCGNSNSCLQDAIVNGSTNHCVGTGPSSLPAVPGNRGITIVNALQARFDADTDWSGNPVGATYPVYDKNVTPGSLDFQHDYLTATKSKKRVLKVAINDGNIPNGSGTYNIDGFGCFFMTTRPIVSPPSSAICLMFVGSCGESGSWTPTAIAPSITKLVLYK